MDSLVTQYLNDIGRFPILTQEEEVELAKKIEKGDGSAKRKLIESNLRLVFSLVKRFFGNNKPIPFLDKIQAGNLGLIEAVKEFDYRRGYKFSSLASEIIKNMIRSEIRASLKRTETKTILVDSWLLDGVLTLNHGERDYDLPIDEEERKRVVEGALEDLTPREQFIIRQKFGFDGEIPTPKEIGDQLNLDRTNIWRIKAKALKKLAKSEEIQELR